MKKIHIYRNDEDGQNEFPSCKVDKRVRSTDPIRNSDPLMATCLGCLRTEAFIFYNKDALTRYLELRY